MPFPTVPAREAVFPYEAVLKDSNAVVFGQVQGIDPDETINTINEPRISDSEDFIAKTSKSGTVTINLYDQDDMKELAILLDPDNQLSEATGWLGTEAIKLTAAAAKQDLTIEYYNSVSAGVLQKTLTLEGFQATGFRKGVQGGDGSIVNVITGTTDDQYYTPTAGVGST